MGIPICCRDKATATFGISQPPQVTLSHSWPVPEMTYKREKVVVPSNAHSWRENVMKCLLKDAG